MCEQCEQVAALLALDIEVAWKAAKSRPEAAMDLLDNLRDRKDRVIHDKAWREMRHKAGCAVFGSET